jgi:Tol biopolymer transport system component
MRLSKWTTGILVAAWISSSTATAQPRDRAEVALRAALEKETVEGNLKAAIDEYKKLAQSANKSVAARALVRLGECYEKQGDANARKTYEQVLSKFGEQTAAVAEARARLAALGIGGQAAQLSSKLAWGSPKSNGDSISPDGRYLSYTDSGTGNLMLHDLATGEDRALTTTGNMKAGEEAYVQGSAISRDGRQIVYGWWESKTKKYELYVANLSGDFNARRLGNAPVVPAAWSPDGKWIAARAIQRDGAQSHWNLALINTQDGSVRTLKSGSEYMRGYSFSPNGKSILYSVLADNNERFRILSLDGKSDVALISEPSPIPGPIHPPVWSPDGSRVVLGSGPPAPSTGLWFVRVVDGKPAGPPERVKGEFNNPFPIGFTQDGSLFYSSTNGRSDVYVAGLDPASGKLTSAPKHVNDRTPGESGGRLAWLPDSKSVSFWSRRMGRYALVVHALASGAEQELWTIENHADGPGYHGWFADGSLLRSEKNGEKALMHRVDSRTLESRARWTIPNYGILQRNREIAFPPDLTAVFFARRAEPIRCSGPLCTHVLAARDFETGRDRELLRFEAASITDLSISPDGRNLAFIAATTRDGSTVLVAPTGGGAPRELFRGPALFNGTAWTPDGAHVLVFSAQSGGEVWSFPAKGGAPVKSVLHLPVFGGVVSPDGTQIAFRTLKAGAGIWAASGLFPVGRPMPAR